MKIRALIIDDEQDSRDVLRLLLSKHCPEVDVIGQAVNASQGRQLIKEYVPDLVFIDVEMPNENGVELLKTFPNKTFQTIFVTGYQQYAIDAIKQSALDYILKPVDGNELKSAVDKLKPVINQHANSSSLTISTGNGFRSIDFDQIGHIKAQSGNYCYFHLLDGEQIVVTKSLTNFENELEQAGFFRVHRGYIVNLKAVSSYESSSGLIWLKDGTELPISTRKRTEFKKAFHALGE